MSGGGTGNEGHVELVDRGVGGQCLRDGSGSNQRIAAAGQLEQGALIFISLELWVVWTLVLLPFKL